MVEASAAPEPIREADYGTIFTAVDTGASHAQRHYVRLIRLSIIITTVTGMLNALAAEVFNHQPALLLISAALIVLGIALDTYTVSERHDRRWYNSRFVAESIRSLVWKYMMGVPPFVGDEHQASEMLLNGMNVLLEGVEDVRTIATERSPYSAPISARMKQVRALHLPARRDLYLANRLVDQLEWYERKAALNARMADRWSLIGLASRAATLLVAIAGLVFHAGLAALVISAISTMTVAFTAWSKVGRYQDLARTYNVTARRLAAARPHLEYADDGPRLTAAVNEIEGILTNEVDTWATSRKNA